MTHVGFIAAAYAVFVLVFVVDAVISHWKLRAARRDALRRQQRHQARRQTVDTVPGADLELGR